MGKEKPQPQAGPELAEYVTTAKPKAYADGVPVFCAHDAIVPLKDLRPNPKNPNQHLPEQIKLLASIIRATGWRGPITVTKYGDLWILGRHRVLCGDCTHPEDRALLLDGAKPEILLTDPPYCSGGQKEAQKSTGSIGTERKDGKAPKIANDILSTRGYQNLIRAALTDIPCLYAYIFTDWRMWVYLFDLVEAAGFGVKSELVWDKGTPGMGVGWRSQHELILFAARAATHFDGHKGYGNVLSVSRSGNELHPTQKPVELLEKLVDNTDFARGVYDPFGGSGTTLAACEAYGQPSYTMELTPAFTDVIVKRYIRITGKQNVRCVRQGRELSREEIAGIFDPDEEGCEQE